MTNEEIYDAEIAPKLMEIGKRCQELGFSICVSVEYGLGDTGRTERLDPSHSAKQKLIHMAARCDGNIDKMLIWVLRDAEKNGHSSTYLQTLGCKNVKFTGNEVAALTIISPA